MRGGAPEWRLAPPVPSSVRPSAVHPRVEPGGRLFSRTREKGSRASFVTQDVCTTFSRESGRRDHRSSAQNFWILAQADSSRAFEVA